MIEYNGRHAALSARKEAERGRGKYQTSRCDQERYQNGECLVD